MPAGLASARSGGLEFMVHDPGLWVWDEGVRIWDESSGFRI